MLTFLKADLFTLDADALVLPANTVGTLGGGLAAAFNRRYPGLLEPYRAACRSGELRIGTIFVWQAPTGERIICLPTKTHYRLDSDLDNIRQGLRALREWVRVNRPRRVALPALGCGLGRLDWREVQPIIQSEMADLDNSEIYACTPDSPFEPPPRRRRGGARTRGPNHF